MNGPAPGVEAERLRREATRLPTPCGEGELVWHRWGEASNAPPVVLLHGGSGSWNHWVRNLHCLREAGRVVLAPDMPGFGDSAAPPDGHDADVLPRWLERGLLQLVAQTRVDLVGFSFGGLVATLWAHEVPERVSRLVLVGAPALSGEHPPLPLRSWHSAAPGAERIAVHRHNLLQGAGHWVPYEAAATFNRLLLEMLAEPLDARAGA